MAIFKLTSADDAHIVILSAKCLSCARSVAAEAAGPEGPRVWRDPSKSTVELLRDNMPAQIIHRSTKNEH